MKPATVIKTAMVLIVLGYAGYVLFASTSMLRKMDPWIQTTNATK